MSGRAHVFGDDIDTDLIIAGPHLGRTDPEYLAQHAFEAVRPDFHTFVQAGDIIVGGKNFGCGSSREQAAIALKGLNISCVVVRSAARIFYRSAINIALPVLIAPGVVDVAQDGDEIDVDIRKAEIRHRGKTLKAANLSDDILRLLNDGGLLAQMKRRLSAERS